MDCLFFYLFRGKRVREEIFFLIYLTSPFKTGAAASGHTLSLLFSPPSIHKGPFSLTNSLCLCLCLSLSSTPSGNKNSLLRRTSQENARVYASTQGTHTSKQKWHSLREAFLRSGSARRTTSARKAPRRVAKTDR